MTEAIAYAVRILRTPKDGGARECWLAPADRHGWTEALWLAKTYPSEQFARVAAERWGATIARIVPIVALEEVPAE